MNAKCYVPSISICFSYLFDNVFDGHSVLLQEITVSLVLPKVRHFLLRQVPDQTALLSHPNIPTVLLVANKSLPLVLSLHTGYYS